MGDQQEGADKRGRNGGKDKAPWARFAHNGEPGDDNGWRQELQNGRRGGVGFFNRQQEGELNGHCADQGEQQQAENVFALFQDAENAIAVQERERQQDKATGEQANHRQKRRRHLAVFHDVLRTNA